MLIIKKNVVIEKLIIFLSIIKDRIGICFVIIHYLLKLYINKRKK